MASGNRAGPIDKVSLERPETGSVRVAEGQRYSWSFRPEEGPISVVGVNHEMYSRDDADEVAFKRVQAIARMIGEPVQGTLEAPHGVDPEGRVPPGTYPVLAYTLLPVWARATLGETVPGG